MQFWAKSFCGFETKKNRLNTVDTLPSYVHLPFTMFPSFFSPQSVLPFFVATKLSKIRRATLDKPSPERYVSAELNTVGLQTQTNGYLPHAIMVSLGM